MNEKLILFQKGLLDFLKLVGKEAFEENNKQGVTAGMEASIGAVETIRKIADWMLKWNAEMGLVQDPTK